MNTCIGVWVNTRHAGVQVIILSIFSLVFDILLKMNSTTSTTWNRIQTLIHSLFWEAITSIKPNVTSNHINPATKSNAWRQQKTANMGKQPSLCDIQLGLYVITLCFLYLETYVQFFNWVSFFIWEDDVIQFQNQWLVPSAAMITCQTMIEA